ncbi:MAG: hypothetical protein JXL80_07635 [Planctomycetes bacterium]|nr:hypothetical protein [Planctomycetota bacterium]
MMTVRSISTAALVAYALLAAMLVAPAATAQDAVEPQEASAPPQSAEMRTFFGVPLDLSQRTAFVIDRSTAMTDYLDVVKAELKRTLNAMASEQQYRIAFVGEKPKVEWPAYNTWVTAHVDSLAKAEKWIDGIEIAGETCDCGNAVAANLGWHAEVIFLVSAGEIDATLPRRLREHPSKLRSTVYTIAVGNEQSRDAMKTLAEQFDGTYRFIPAADLAGGFKPAPLPSGPTRHAECTLMVRGKSRTIQSLRGSLPGQPSVLVSSEAYLAAFRATVDPEGSFAFKNQRWTTNSEGDLALANLPCVEVTDTRLVDGALVRLKVDISGEANASLKPAAREFLATLVRNLRTEEAMSYEFRVNDRRGDIEPQKCLQGEYRQRLFMLTDEIMATRREFPGPLSMEIIEQMQRDMEQLDMQLDLDLAGKEQRMAAVREQMAKIPGEVAERLKNDEVAAELEKALAAREEQLQIRRKLETEGRASRDEVLEAETRVVDVRTHLAERREMVSHAAGSELLSRLIGELAMLQIETKEIRARRDKIQQQKAKVLDFMTVASKYREMLDMQEDLRKKMALVEGRIGELQLEVGRIDPPATIDVVGMIEAR